MTQFQREAIKQSLKSTYKYALGAVVVYRGKIVGRGYNSVNYVGGRTILNGTHAEIDAINDTRAAHRKGATMYVVRWRKQGDLGCARPCKTCEKVLRKLGIKTVWYSDYGNCWKRLTL